MFRKIVSNLPFQPSLLAEVSFYLNRLKKEESVRRLGFLLLAVGFGLQIFIVLFPPVSTVATHQADIIYGANSQSDVLEAYRRNEDQLGRKDIRAIYNYYGIGEAQIKNAKKVTISDGDKNFINTSRNVAVEGRTFVSIDGAVDGGIYEFPLTYWRKNEYPNGYPALTGLSSYGFRFWILLKGCGNIVFEKGAKKPKLEITKGLLTGSQAKVGSILEYEIKFRNGGAYQSNNTSIKDSLPNGLEYISFDSNLDLKLSSKGNELKWLIDNPGSQVGAGSRWYYIKLKTKAVSEIKSTCNVATISASNASKASSSSDSACVQITPQLCPGTNLPVPSGGYSECQVTCPNGSYVNYNQSCPVPLLACSELDIHKGSAWNERIFSIQATAQNGAIIDRVEYYVDNVLVSAVPNGQDKTFPYTHVFSNEGKFSVQAKLITNSQIDTQNDTCTVVENITKPDSLEAIITTDKKVSNVTQSIDDANNTTANAGDVLLYTLFIENKGTADANNLALNNEYAEDVADILEYASITNLYDGVLNKDSAKITWAPVNIKAGESVVKKFEVKIKNPIPNTPTSSSNPLSYDYQMFNTYGRSVNIKLNKSALKQVEQTASVLPNTGPMDSVLYAALVVIIAGYFYYRSSLLKRELYIIRQDYSSGGY